MSITRVVSVRQNYYNNLISLAQTLVNNPVYSSIYFPNINNRSFYKYTFHISYYKHYLLRSINVGLDSSTLHKHILQKH